MNKISTRITGYLTHGGLINPEYMDHLQVRDLLIDARAEIDKLETSRNAWRTIAVAVGII